jgi:two-component system sensor histidine kinase PhcS
MKQASTYSSKRENPMTIDEQLLDQAKFREAFLANEKQVRISTGKLACALVFVLMPFGVTLDFFVHRDHLLEFFELRLLCSLLIAIVWSLHSTPIARKHYPVVGLPIVILPAFFITWMVYKTGSADPYYAGLNLIMLAVSAVGHWSLVETFLAVGSVILMYLASCVARGFDAGKNGTAFGPIFNNFYFLVLTGVIVICGNHLFNRLRFREFVLRYKLNQNRRALEASLQQLKENEMQLVQSEKLASLGRMSAGIIHEINNPLNFATTGLFTLRKKGKHLAPEQQADYTEVLTDVEDGLKRVQAIVSDLRMFTHPNTEQLDPVPVAEVITPALRFLSNEWRDTVEIEQKLAQHQTIWANKNKLIQVMVNIFQNSIDALKIKSFAAGEKPAIWIEGRVENGQSILSIRDNGTGIESKHLGKIFDPFFTTKDVGSGMGLGLSISYSIVQEYGGKISVKTEPGKFCEFTLEFPVRNHQATN